MLEVEFRGGTGFGAGHVEAGLKQWGLAMQNGIAESTHWAIAQGIADPARIRIAGASHGVYAARMGLVGDPDKDAAQLAATSPIQQATRIRQPVLLAYGAKTSVSRCITEKILFRGHGCRLRGMGGPAPPAHARVTRRMARFRPADRSQTRPSGCPRARLRGICRK